MSLRVPNRFKLDWIRAQYAGLIESVLSELAAGPVRLELNLAPREVLARVPGTAMQPRQANGAAHVMSVLPQSTNGAAAAPIEGRERNAQSLAAAPAADPRTVPPAPAG